tara:strand:+ start:503 stop:943 length:441 start_codon:yes stop_codon:yes gene_type:complete
MLALVVDLLTAGRTLAQVSADVDVPLVTLMSWQAQPGFTEAYATGRRVRALHLQSLIEDAAVPAVRELARLSVAARSEGDRIKAGEALLERTPQGTRAQAQPRDTAADAAPVVEIHFQDRLAAVLAGRTPDKAGRIDVTPPDDATG